jgi:hypothetical protein
LEKVPALPPKKVFLQQFSIGIKKHILNDILSSPQFGKSANFTPKKVFFLQQFIIGSRPEQKRCKYFTSIEISLKFCVFRNPNFKVSAQTFPFSTNALLKGTQE